MKKQLVIKKVVFYVLCMIIFTGCSRNNNMNTSIEIWHYYNGAQKIAFDEMVVDFNETVGFEKGIIVEAFSQGNINELQTTILESIDKKVGAKELPNVVTAYPDTARRIDHQGIVVNLKEYIKDKEIEKYVTSYIEEGYLANDDKLSIFPIAKATEIMMVNKTDWDKFAQATGAKIEELETWEGLAKTAEAYYNWTDSLTEIANDGKAFFGRDAMANYMIIGAKQLGQELFEVEDDKAIITLEQDIMRRLWDNYYVPYISGYYGSFGRFSSDDARTGEIIAFVGSTTGAAYFPDNVTVEDNESYNIEALMLPVPNFENTKPVAIQQGAGMVVLKSDKAQEKAAVEFLKWFTEAERNTEFSFETGYLPVTKEANIRERFEEKLQQASDEKMSKELQEALRVAMEQSQVYELHAGKVFENGDDAREFLTEALINQAKIDRKKVVELIEKGVTHKEAVSQIAIDSNFEHWLMTFEANLKEIIN